MSTQVVLIKVVVSIGCHVKHFDCSGPVVRTRCTHDNQLLQKQYQKQWRSIQKDKKKIQQASAHFLTAEKKVTFQIIGEKHRAVGVALVNRKPQTMLYYLLVTQP